MAIIEKTRKLLRQAFPTPAAVELWRMGSRITGYVASTRFEGLDFIDRQELVDEAIDSLSKTDRNKIIIILTMTPEEREAYLACPINGNGRKSRKVS